jgi:two-component system sensor histidine kinase ResE
VGKLWATIIGLVALVLIALSLFLTQFFDRFYYQQESNDLERLGTAVVQVLSTNSNQSLAFQNVSQLIEGEDRRLVVLDSTDDLTSPTADSDILLDPRVQEGWTGKKVIFRDYFKVERNGENKLVDMLVVAIPYEKNNQKKLVVLYESLTAVTETIKGTKSLILYAAGLGILLTTIFAFFLSTRITRPLLQMKEAADQIAKGDFKTRVTIRSNDEIGELSSTLNYMAGKLDETVHLLSSEKEKIASILRSMADGVISVDLNMKIKITNPQAERYLFFWQYEADDLPEPLYELFRDSIQRNEEVAKDIEIKGTYLAVVVSPLNDRDGISGAVAVFRDVTNERKLDKLRSDFVANISHELRTPIAMLQGYSEAILDGIAATEEEQRELVKIIFDESVRMSKLVNELLDLARIEAGHLQLVPAKISLNQLLDKIGRKFNGLTRERRIQLTVDKLPGDDTVFLDQDRMEQVLTNLIDNAIRHTPDHGEIRVTPSKKEKILQIEVSDTGSGIDPEDIPYLFERFYKGDKARTRGRSGTGLGLSIVKNIVEAHKGHIYVESTLGEGTSFKIQIPQSD